MSPEAIDQRLRDLSQIYQLGVSLRNAVRLGKVRDLRVGTETNRRPA